ncbi:MAG: response regulator, partial [Anaerolineae bacterium]|nr:response regulator [Anaerolineae bacterium]
HDFIGKHVDEILTPDIAQLSTDAAIAALDSGNEQIYQYRMPNRLTGAPTDYEARVTPCGEDEVQVIIRDITEEKLRIERQQQAQRLESLGMLAGGIAHDFNNLLTSIMAQTSLANAKLMRNQQPFEQLERAQMATQRAADLTRQLLAYAGKTVVEVAAIDLNQLIRDNVALLETALPVSAELRLKLTDQAVIIQADRGHIQQVVMNITINAADALRHSLQKEAQLSTALAASQNMQTFVLATQPNKARFIAIHTTITEIDSPQQHLNILGNELAPGHYVSLKVEDNGIGMDEATIKQVFDPFFSTKEQGHGLGLSATLGIMRSYGGAIYVESTLGSGTVFTLLFPTIQVVPREHKKGLEMHKATKNEVIFEIHPTVLVIDDELSIREVVTDILQMKGFTIYQAANGEEGIKQLQKYQNTIDLVLLDMKMPGLSGDETLTYIRQLQPSLKVILSSGFTQTDVGSKLKNNTVSAFLPKPYSQEQLLHTIYQVLAILPQVRPT